MRKVAVSIFIILLLSGLVYVFAVEQSHKNGPAISPSPSQTRIQTNPTFSASTLFCKSSELQGSIQTEGAAGSIYGTMNIKNISDKTCVIAGNNFIQPLYKAKNISVEDQGQAGPTQITLMPNQTIYSQVRYQNGPQCSTPPRQEMVTFRYSLSEGDYLVFKNQSGSSQQPVVVCESPTESTLISVWSLSSQPITP